MRPSSSAARKRRHSPLKESVVWAWMNTFVSSKPSAIRLAEHVDRRLVVPLFPIGHHIDRALNAVTVEQVGQPQARQALDLHGARPRNTGKHEVTRLNTR